MIFAATPSPDAGVLASFCTMDSPPPPLPAPPLDSDALLLLSSAEEDSVREGGGAMAAPEEEDEEEEAPPPEPAESGKARPVEIDCAFAVVESQNASLE